jgi:tetratricopeptide (TPR) repeat protein
LEQKIIIKISPLQAARCARRHKPYTNPLSNIKNFNLKKPNFKIIFFLIVCITFSNGYSQIDSLRNILEDEKKSDSIRFKAINTYYLTNTYAQPDSVLVLINYHYDLAKEKKFIKEMAKALNEKSYAYYIKGDTKKSMEFLMQSIKLYEQLDEPLTLATLYSNIGNIYGEEKKYQEAVRYFNSSLEIFRKQGQKTGEVRMLHNLGVIYNALDIYDVALTYLNKSLELNQKLNKEKETGGTFLEIGKVYYNKAEYYLAIELSKKALELLISNNNKFSTADCYFLISKSYHKLNQPEKAYDYIEKSLVIDYEIKNTSKIIQRRTLKANLIYESNLVDEAIKQAEEILKLVQSETINQLKADIYNLLYKCYKAKRNYSLSLSMNEQYIVYSDSVQIEKNKIVVIREAIQNEYDSKLYKNNLKSEKEKAALKVLQLKKTYTITIAAALIIFSVVFYFRSKIKKNQAKRELLLNEIEELKNNANKGLIVDSNKFELNREKIERAINRKLNETDWTVLNVLLEDPVITNIEIAEKVFMSVDGIGSSLRRMYEYFNIKESKYKKISLLLEAIKISNNSNKIA